MSEAYHFLRLHHGTSRSYSEIICREGFKLPETKRNDHWLGEGVYFFRDDVEQATIWAVSKFKNRSSENEAHVLEVTLNLTEGEFLNLDSRAGMNFINEFIKASYEELEGIEFDGEPEKLRNFIMDLLPEKYTVLQRTFRGDSLFDKIPLFNKMELCLHGVQVCVRNIKAITSGVRLVSKRPIIHQTRPNHNRKAFKINS